MAESGEAWSVPPIVVTFSAGSQKEASYNIDKKIYDSLVESASTRREKKRRARVAEPHAGAWVTAVPSTDDGRDTVMRPQVFRTAMAYRLGAKVVANEIPCPMCMQTVDILGDHPACCIRNGERIVRHNRVRDLVANICREGLLAVC